MSPPFRIESLTPEHDRTGFCCGDEELDRYFKERVNQDIRRRVSACFVAVESVSECVAGFYTLAAGSVALKDLPEDMVKRLPRYPSLPVARLGRLAVDVRFQGRRLGGALLWDAIQRSARSEIAVFALAVDAMNEKAAAFYRHHGFRNFESLPRQWFLPLKGHGLL